ncbi:MAG: PQQ-dependent sugar dehydrogenase [Anaerolineales bacterium]
MIKSFRIFSIIAICVLAIGTISASPAAKIVPPSPTPPVLTFIPVAAASNLTEPVFFTNAGDGTNRFFIVQQTGQILVMDTISSTPTHFLDISSLGANPVTDFISNLSPGGDTEQGLLGLAFDPNYATNGYFYITYTTDVDLPCPYITTNGDDCPFATTLARYQVSSNPDVADDTTGTVLLSVPKRFSNHNGGMIAFGPDGYLYMSIGDGGAGGDPDGNGQSLDTLSGKLLRLDVDGTPDSGKKYAIPHTNPFYGSSDSNVQQEIWAYGLRNSWRFSFDKLTGDLYIGDVGQDRQEEVDFQSHSSAGGQNYGWHILEGNLCYNPMSGCVKPANYVPPVATYNHGVNDSYGCALMGGYVYRGSQFPSMQGWYFYGDLCSGKVLGLVKNGNTWKSTLLASTPYNITSFGEDEQGELYLIDYAGGQILQISEAPTNATSTLTSQGNLDGFITESSAGSGEGGTFNSTGKWFNVGDTSDNRQMRAILSFTKASLPAQAVISSATLKIKLYKISGDPFGALGDLSADIAVPNFGSSSALEAGDFSAAATDSGIATFSPLSGGWYSAAISDPSDINLTGTTQFRLAFTDDSAGNYASFYSGNYGISSRPQLIIQYSIP